MFIHDTLVEHRNALDNHHFEHGTVHLSVGRRDQIRWVSDAAFTIDIKKDDHPPSSSDAPPNPFPGKWPMESGRGLRVDSGPPLARSVGQRYKAIVTIGGVTYDPDIVCEP